MTVEPVCVYRDIILSGSCSGASGFVLRSAFHQTAALFTGGVEPSSPSSHLCCQTYHRLKRMSSVLYYENPLRKGSAVCIFISFLLTARCILSAMSIPPPVGRLKCALKSAGNDSRLRKCKACRSVPDMKILPQNARLTGPYPP